jgi:hypothetical protein
MVELTFTFAPAVLAGSGVWKERPMIVSGSSVSARVHHTLLTMLCPIARHAAMSSLKHHAPPSGRQTLLSVFATPSLSTTAESPG